MKLKTYAFNKYDKVYVSDGNGGFSTVDKEKLSDLYNEELVVEKDATSHIEWDIDGTAYRDFYIKNDFGNIVRMPFEDDETVSCCVYNTNAKTGKSFCVEYENGELSSTNPVCYIIGKDSVLTEQKVVVPPGRYRRTKGICGGSFLVMEMEIYNDEEHAAWYSAPTIDNVKETSRAGLVKIDDAIYNRLTTIFIELKSFADVNNIKLVVDEYSGDIRAVKVPEGYKVESDEGYSNAIPWELMPVIGKCAMTMNEDSDYQPCLKKVE